MAIANMKKVTLLAMNADRSKLMRKLQRLGCVEIIAQDPTEQSIAQDHEKLDELNKRVERLDWAIKKLTPFDTVKKDLFSQRIVADEEAIVTAQAGQVASYAVVDRLEEIERSLSELRTKEQREQALIAQLAPWEELTQPLERLVSTRHVYLAPVSASMRNWSLFMKSLENLDVSPAIEVISNREGNVYALLAIHASVREQVDVMMREGGVERVQFEEMSGMPALLIDQAKSRIDRIGEVRTQLNEEIKTLGREIQSLRVLRDVEVMARDRQAASSRLFSTQSAFLLKGWVPEDRVPEVEAAAKKACSLCEIEFSDPADDEKPPTLLHNNQFNQPFEAIINMFSLPDPRGLDATALIAPFYICFFGMMVSDAGYGLVMALLCALYVWKAKPTGGKGQLIRVIMWGGVGTLFWGIMFGGWFGVEVTPVLFVPLNSPVETMVLCIGVGFLHVLFGVFVGAYMNIKRGKVWDAVWDQGTWILILTGVALLLLENTAQIGTWMVVAGLMGLLLMGGRNKKNIAKRLLSGAGKLYDITGFMSDILSYVRLFGMGLATGVIGMVINILAQMVMGSPIGVVIGVVILLGGHAFNLAINALGAYVNASRLQYIEFFGHFYEQGGVPFKPLRYNTRYVDIDSRYDVN